MSDPYYQSAEDYWAQFNQKHANSIVVEVTGFQHFRKRTHPKYKDTFDWVTGEEIDAFFVQHGLPRTTIRSSDVADLTKFYFPADRKDIAALFKLTFA